MQSELFRNEAAKIWRSLSNDKENPENLLIFELDFYKKMLVFFQLGESCYLIFNFQTLLFDFASPEVRKVLGYPPEECTVALFMQNIHPEDRAWFLNVQETAGQFILGLPAEKQMKYKLRIDYRIRKQSGEYIRVMHQSIVAQNDEEGKILRTLVILTDITHIKSTGRPVLSYIGMEGEPSYQDVSVQNLFPGTKTTLSKREQQVLFHIAEGKLSKQIADILQISKATVDTHRKNLLRKLAVSNTGELISKAVSEGLI